MTRSSIWPRILSSVAAAALVIATASAQAPSVPSARLASASRLNLPGEIDSNAIGQRRWALEWAVVFHGPYHDAPLAWEEIDLSV